MPTFTHAPHALARRALIAVLAVALPSAAANAQDPPASSSRATRRFELRSDARTALHHLLIDWALADAGAWPPFAPPIAERESWRSRLDPVEARVWSDAVRAYDRARGRSLLFDDGLLALREWAVGRGERAAIPDADRVMAHVLDAALPVYLRHWWPDHDRRNRAWIDAMVGKLREVEEAMARRLSTAYGGAWPDGRIPVDVVPYANDVGAYSTAGRVTLSSVDRDNGMPQAVELVFHEASHMHPLEGPLREGLRDAFRAAGGEAPARLWHDLIFYTTGETLRIVLEERGEPGYRHYGEGGVYARRERWSVELPALDLHWRPYLRSGSTDGATRRAALEALARQLLDESERD